MCVRVCRKRPPLRVTVCRKRPPLHVGLSCVHSLRNQAVNCVFVAGDFFFARSQENNLVKEVLPNVADVKVDPRRVWLHCWERERAVHLEDDSCFSCTAAVMGSQLAAPLARRCTADSFPRILPLSVHVVDLCGSSAASVCHSG